MKSRQMLAVFATVEVRT